MWTWRHGTAPTTLLEASEEKKVKSDVEVIVHMAGVVDVDAVLLEHGLQRLGQPELGLEKGKKGGGKERRGSGATSGCNHLACDY